MVLAAIRVLSHNARKSILSKFSPVQQLLASVSSHSRRFRDLTSFSFEAVTSLQLCFCPSFPHELWFISNANTDLPLSPSAIMRTCHSVALLLASFVCGFVCADGETLFESDVIDKAEGVVGGSALQPRDLASVSLALQSLGVPQKGYLKTTKRIRLRI